jgi:hypothetical protein
VTGRRARLAALGGTLALALVLCGCGVPTSGARAIKVQVPTPPTAVSTTAPLQPSDEIQVTIVLLSGTVPHPVTRYSPQQLDRLATVLSDLLIGPQPGDIQSGLSTAIPSATKLIGVSPNPSGTPGEFVPTSNAVTVNLSSDFLETIGPSQVLAVEQVVFTIACDLTTSVATRVAFEVEGVPQDVPIANGTSVAGPVSASDYLPPGATLSCS